MDCVYHAGAPASGNCIACGFPACGTCLEMVAGHPMCRSCIEAQQQQMASAPAATAGPAAATAPPYNAAPAAVVQEDLPAQPIHYLKAFLFGLVAALIGAWIWDKFVIITSIQIGFVAVFLGFGVAIAVRTGAENRSGIGLSIIGALLCAFCVLFGYVLIADEVATKQSAEIARIPFLVRLPVLVGAVIPNLDLMDWVFVAIAVWEGWSIPGRRAE